MQVNCTKDNNCTLLFDPFANSVSLCRYALPLLYLFQCNQRQHTRHHQKSNCIKCTSSFLQASTDENEWNRARQEHIPGIKDKN